MVGERLRKETVEMVECLSCPCSFYLSSIPSHLRRGERTLVQSKWCSSSLFYINEVNIQELISQPPVHYADWALLVSFFYSMVASPPPPTRTLSIFLQCLLIYSFLPEMRHKLESLQRMQGRMQVTDWQRNLGRNQERARSMCTGLK